MFYVELQNGHCGLSNDTEASIRRQEGSNNIKRITKATKDQIAWVRAMGGYVPENRKEGA